MKKYLYIAAIVATIAGGGIVYVLHTIPTVATIRDAPDFNSATPYLHLVRESCPETDVSDDYVCIYRLSHSTLAAADALANKLIADPPVPTELPEQIRAAQKVRDTYFDGVCGLDEMLIYGGSGMDLEREACRYYYAQEYLQILQHLSD